VRCSLPIALLLIATLPLDPSAADETPSKVKLQGFLNDLSGGNPVPANGSFSMTFEVFDADTNGTLVASVGPLPVSVSQGLFEVLLPLTPDVFDGPDRFLQLTVDGEMLLPRTTIASTAFAFRADKAGVAVAVEPGAIDNTALAQGAVTQDKLGIVCGDGEILTFTGGTWTCAAQTLPAVCLAGTSFSCYTGPSSTLDIGECRAGLSACRMDGSGFEACQGAVGPSAEQCSSGLDEDCDGLTDQNDPDCFEFVCDDIVDNDGDMLVDCDDPDCAGDAACQTPAVVRINEFNANISGGCDLVELHVVAGGSMDGFELWERTASVLTFANLSVQTGDFVVVHLNSAGCNASGSGNETASPAEYPNATHPQNIDIAYDWYSTDSGLASTDNVLTLYDHTGTVVDAVLASDAPTGTATSSSEAQAAVVAAAGHWMMVGGGVPPGGFVDDDFNAHAVQDLNNTGTDSFGTSIQRNTSVDTETKADWTDQFNATWGSLNPGQ